MNREQMIKKAALAIRAVDGPATIGGHLAAAAVVDALLPQVTTVAELKALPASTYVADRDGVVWRAWRWNDSFEMFFYSTIASLGPSDVAEIVKRGPLTVVWQS